MAQATSAFCSLQNTTEKMFGGLYCMADHIWVEGVFSAVDQQGKFVFFLGCKPVGRSLFLFVSVNTCRFQKLDIPRAGQDRRLAERPGRVGEDWVPMNEFANENEGALYFPKHRKTVVSTPVESKNRTHNGRVGSARRRADGGAGRRWAKQGADISVALEANRPSGFPAQCKQPF